MVKKCKIEEDGERCATDVLPGLLVCEAHAPKEVLASVIRIQAAAIEEWKRRGARDNTPPRGDVH